MDTAQTLTFYCQEDYAAYQLHMEHEGEIVSHLLRQGRSVKTTQSAHAYSDGDGVGLETVLFTGFTSIADSKTHVVTYNNGKKKSWSEKIVK